MRNSLRTILLAYLILIPAMVNGQVLISLIFGEALNSDKIEFGLIGGFNRTNIYTIENAKGLNNFNLGFYFHIMAKNNSYISTGVLVKSNVGATGMPTYLLENADFDSLYQEGTLTKNIPVFYVPILFHQRFNNRWYVEAGPQLGLIYKAKDIFETTELDGDLTYTRNVQDEYVHIDAGIVGGVGYKFKQQIKSMAVGISYYQGLVNVSKNADLRIINASLNIYVKIPIGVGDKEKEN